MSGVENITFFLLAVITSLGLLLRKSESHDSLVKHHLHPRKLIGLCSKMHNHATIESARKFVNQTPNRAQAINNCISTQKFDCLKAGINCLFHNMSPMNACSLSERFLEDCLPKLRLDALSLPRYNPTTVFKYRVSSAVIRKLLLDAGTSINRVFLRIEKYDGCAMVWVEGEFIGIEEDCSLSGDMEVTNILMSKYLQKSDEDWSFDLVLQQISDESFICPSRASCTTAISLSLVPLPSLCCIRDLEWNLGQSLTRSSTKMGNSIKERVTILQGSVLVEWMVKKSDLGRLRRDLYNNVAITDRLIQIDVFLDGVMVGKRIFDENGNIVSETRQCSPCLCQQTVPVQDNHAIQFLFSNSESEASLEACSSCTLPVLLPDENRRYVTPNDAAMLKEVDTKSQIIDPVTQTGPHLSRSASDLDLNARSSPNEAFTSPSLKKSASAIDEGTPSPAKSKTIRFQLDEKHTPKISSSRKPKIILETSQPVHVEDLVQQRYPSRISGSSQKDFPSYLDRNLAYHDAMILDFSSACNDEYVRLPAEVKFEIPVSNPVSWSPEEPSLYTLVVSLLCSSSGKILQSESCRVGFRKIEVTDGTILINGKRIQISGVNYEQDESIEKFSKSRIEQDIVQLKRCQVNSIRCVLGVKNPWLLELCSLYGLYVVDEIKVGLQNFNPAFTNLSRVDSWKVAILNRVRQTYECRKVHPCIYGWSLEGGGNRVHAEVSSWIRNNDSHGRLFLSEFSSFGDKESYHLGPIEKSLWLEASVFTSKVVSTDILFPKLASVRQCRNLVNRFQNFPLILNEFADVKTNCGWMSLYLQAFRRYKRIQGGYLSKMLACKTHQTKCTLPDIHGLNFCNGEMRALLFELKHLSHGLSIRISDVGISSLDKMCISLGMNCAFMLFPMFGELVRMCAASTPPTSAHDLNMLSEPIGISLDTGPTDQFESKSPYCPSETSDEVLSRRNRTPVISTSAPGEFVIVYSGKSESELSTPTALFKRSAERTPTGQARFDVELLADRMKMNGSIADISKGKNFCHYATDDQNTFSNFSSLYFFLVKIIVTNDLLHISNVSGKYYFTGTLLVDGLSPNRSSVDVEAVAVKDELQHNATEDNASKNKIFAQNLTFMFAFPLYCVSDLVDSFAKLDLSVVIQTRLSSSNSWAEKGFVVHCQQFDIKFHHEVRTYAMLEEEKSSRASFVSKSPLISSQLLHSLQQSHGYSMWKKLDERPLPVSSVNNPSSDADLNRQGDMKTTESFMSVMMTDSSTSTETKETTIVASPCSCLSKNALIPCLGARSAHRNYLQQCSSEVSEGKQADTISMISIGTVPILRTAIDNLTGLMSRLTFGDDDYLVSSEFGEPMKFLFHSSNVESNFYHIRKAFGFDADLQIYGLAVVTVEEGGIAQGSSLCSQDFTNSGCKINVEFNMGPKRIELDLIAIFVALNSFKDNPRTAEMLISSLTSRQALFARKYVSLIGLGQSLVGHCVRYCDGVVRSAASVGVISKKTKNLSRMDMFSLLRKHLSRDTLYLDSKCELWDLSVWKVSSSNYTSGKTGRGVSFEVEGEKLLPQLDNSLSLNKCDSLWHQVSNRVLLGMTQRRLQSRHRLSSRSNTTDWNDIDSSELELQIPIKLDYSVSNFDNQPCLIIQGHIGASCVPFCVLSNISLQLLLPHNISSVCYYGLGPGENYPNRCVSSIRAVHDLSALSNSDIGERSGTEWVEITDVLSSQRAAGIRVSSSNLTSSDDVVCSPFSFSCKRLCISASQYQPNLLTIDLMTNEAEDSCWNQLDAHEFMQMEAENVNFCLRLSPVLR